MKTAEIDYEADEQFVDESPAVNGLRYFAMRFVRMVLSIVAEMSMLSLAAVVAVSLFLCIEIVSTPNANSIIISQYGEATWRSMWFRHPFVAITLALAGLPVSWGVLMALSLPYRYKTRAPGSGVVRCGTCGDATADCFTCSECGAFRPYRIVTMAVGLLNVLMTIAWIAHDIIFFVVTVWTATTDLGPSK